MQSKLLHETLLLTAESTPLGDALIMTDSTGVNYQGLLDASRSLGSLCLELGAVRGDRIGYVATKSMLSATAPYAVSGIGGVFVPINPGLTPEQMAHIVQDCDLHTLICDAERVPSIRSLFEHTKTLKRLIVSGDSLPDLPDGIQAKQWHPQTIPIQTPTSPPVGADTTCALLYTSGSTGKPKGVMVSHRNMLDGIASVSEYLSLTSADRILAALPFSFDYGLNQLTSAIAVGATCILHDYLLPADIDRAISVNRATGLAGVPTIWNQLSEARVPKGARVDSLRYFTNSGGAIAKTTLDKIRQRYPSAAPFLMYGLTEAFRSTYLPPKYIDGREGSIGVPIPGAKILVVNDAGGEAAPGEQGELVHYGRHVTLGYWNNPQATAEKFRAVPKWAKSVRHQELGVWTGDFVSIDEDGFLYFVGRRDNLIKTSGYRVSPEEIEEVAFKSGMVSQVAAFGVEDSLLGQAVALAVEPLEGVACDVGELLVYCRANLPGYMVPKKIALVTPMPLNANRKPDRVKLKMEFEAIDAPY